MNWFKKAQGVYGEWWITDTGDTLFADGDVGDSNHEMYVIEQILGNYFDMDSIDSPDAYTISKMQNQELLKIGMTQEEINVVKGRMDARQFAMKNWGWIRVADKYVQAWTINNDTLNRIADGLYEAYGNDALRQNFVIENLSTGQNFSPVPYNIIASGNVTELRGFIEFNSGAIAKKINIIEKKASNNSYPYERAGDIHPVEGEGGFGIYAYPSSNNSMRDYYARGAGRIYFIRPHDDAVILDLTTNKSKKDIIGIGNKNGYKTNLGNYHKEIWAIKEYLYGKNYDAYLLPHIGHEIPTGKQLVITNANKFDFIERK